MLSISLVTLGFYDWPSSKLCKCTFCFCIKHILNLDEPKHSNPSLARPPLGVKHIAKEWVEALCKNPGTLQTQIMTCFCLPPPLPPLCFLKGWTSFFTIQSSISLSLSCSSGLQSVTTVLTRSSKSFTCCKVAQVLLECSDWDKCVMILRQNLWKWSPSREASLAWEVAGVLRPPATINEHYYI